MAELAVQRLEGHLRDVASLAADRRQDPAGAESVDESLLAHHAYPTATGLTTSVVPHGHESFQIDFDFLQHELVIRSASGGVGRIRLEPQPVSAFYASVMTRLTELGLPVRIHARPNETPSPIAFGDDHVPRAYDRESVTRYWRALLQVERVLVRFRARFIGKCSPVHLFWGAPDLAVTRFSGRRAPEHPGGVPNLPDRVTREADPHEVSSCGFWAGNVAMPYAAFYAYAYPEPEGFAAAPVSPDGAFYSQEFREFILPYDVVRESDSPDETLMRFLQSDVRGSGQSGAMGPRGAGARYAALIAGIGDRD